MSGYTWDGRIERNGALVGVRSGGSESLAPINNYSSTDTAESSTAVQHSRTAEQRRFHTTHAVGGRRIYHHLASMDGKFTITWHQ